MISVAEDAIFMWNLLGGDEIAHDPLLDPDDMVVIGKREDKSIKKTMPTEGKMCIFVFVFILRFFNDSIFVLYVTIIFFICSDSF